MKNLAYTWWRDESHYIGFLNSHPDYETQGESVSELEENLRDIYMDIQSQDIPYLRHVSELTIA